jgi:hypothetical protein
MLVALLVVVLPLLSVCSTLEELRVGIYNAIPDLNSDSLASYKAMIENGFNNSQRGVAAVVDKDQYSPYGNLEEYLSAGGFDLIEMDTANLKEVVDKNLIITVNVPRWFLPSALNAVSINGREYGYPTLVCGNFLITLLPRRGECDLIQARDSGFHFANVLESCRQEICGSSYERLIGGKMNDAFGWYLPFIYLDGYIDIHGPRSLQTGVEELKRGKTDPLLCHRLNWLIGNCDNFHEQIRNKCYQNFTGSYVRSSSNITPDMVNNKTFLYFGFSEKFTPSEIQSGHQATAAISGPLGQHNILLQFTDALVMNRARWDAAGAEKRRALVDFFAYFVSDGLRASIAMGEDLRQPRPRYLLPATSRFYRDTQNLIYQQLFWSLNTAVAAPSLSKDERVAIQNTLTRCCVRKPPTQSVMRG